ncbi:hypothetical protein PsYK624_031740 [Phanerochaete sordida]|uniref:Uncharacterized protein n=1 Tax=Phanerochaete sordida TaxID=48140 RepID=A0A9P3G2L4_9APHY|nr:hypothetical protein PsYK624_031740 [Phanerochaete sordida]
MQSIARWDEDDELPNHEGMSVPKPAGPGQALIISDLPKRRPPRLATIGSPRRPALRHLCRPTLVLDDTARLWSPSHTQHTLRPPSPLDQTPPDSFQPAPTVHPPVLTSRASRACQAFSAAHVSGPHRRDKGCSRRRATLGPGPRTDGSSPCHHA